MGLKPESEKKDRMKYLLADALKVCMKTAPLEKITVKEIVDQCGTARQTFYRHFQDKYDLVNWYFDKMLLESFKHMGEGRTVYEGLVNKFTFLRQEKLFFKAAFKNDEQNNLRDHDFCLILDFYTKRIEGKTGRKMPEHLQFQLEMYCQGSIYMTVKWLLANTKRDPEELAKELVDAMPVELRKLFEHLELL